MKVVIIGGVAAGTKTAAKIKREDRSADVLILSKSGDISYAGCGLPYYVGGSIPSRDALIVNTPKKYEGLTEPPFAPAVRCMLSIRRRRLSPYGISAAAPSSPNPTTSWSSPAEPSLLSLPWGERIFPACSVFGHRRTPRVCGTTLTHGTAAALW